MISMLWVFMIFCHILDDFHFQGILANMKQRDWWKSQPKYNDLYKNDWKIALGLHSFSWSFMIQLPLIAYAFYIGRLEFCLDTSALTLIINALIHGIVDHYKCNKYEISLVTDQCIHLVQIIMTYWIWRLFIL